jgi:Fur family ferric uptake transcriptional regulator
MEGKGASFVGADPLELRFALAYGCFMAHEVEQRILASYLDENALKHTRQRQAILEVFLEAPGHITSEDLSKRVRELYPRIGHTTVYRTLRLLCDAGLASERRFDDGATRYEAKRQHHDHLVCLRCGTIIEFESSMIEGAQQEIAKRHGFRVLRHRHELYGYCSDCQQQGS